MSPRQSAILLCHPAALCPAVARIEVGISPSPAGGLSLAYRLTGRLAELAIPAPQPAAPADGLWEHSCFEAFVAVPGEPAYREFNFSPSGRWASYSFFGYRQRDESIAPGPAPAISVRRFADRLELDAVLAPELLPGAPLQLGLTTVVETADGGLSYWALAHPAGRPDFHHRDAFIVTLASPNPCN